jgi:hypothetical protein
MVLPRQLAIRRHPIAFSREWDTDTSTENAERRCSFDPKSWFSGS